MTFYKNVHCDTQSGPSYFEPIPQVDEIYSPMSHQLIVVENMLNYNGRISLNLLPCHVDVVYNWVLFAIYHHRIFLVELF
jgi:hypothetical protein